jgi:thiol:disulfide interchange protein DsbD
MNKNLLQIYFILCISINLYAQFNQPANVLTSKFIFPAEKLAKQTSYPLLIQINIKKGWHINSHKPLEEYLVPTEIKFVETDGITHGNIRYQNPVLKKFSFTESNISVYENTVFIYTSITIMPDFKHDSLKIKSLLRYQACDDKSCLAPEEIQLIATVPIVDHETLTRPINQSIFADVVSGFEELEAKEQKDKGVADILRESGILYILLFIFIGGLALNLTPCVYPLIPITISYFSGKSDGSKGGLFIHAILYVFGMAVTYSILGVTAALTGSIFGSVLQNPFVLLFIACFLFILALSMFGLYEIQIPQKLALIGGKSRMGYLGTLFMGLTVGLIAAPCIGPFILGLLTFVSEQGDPLMGFWYFFVLSLGLGTPFLILGIFSGAVNKLPRSGIWMVWIRKIFGFILIAMAIYFLEPLFPIKKLYFYTLTLLGITAGIYLGWMEKSAGGKGFIMIKRITGTIFIMLSLILIIPFKTQEKKQINWQKYSLDVLIQSKLDRKAVIIDFFADWCIPCKELDEFTFSDERIILESRKYITLKADLTLSNTANELGEKYNIKGLPTLLFLKPDGEELKQLRLVGFENADKFYQRMKKIESMISPDSPGE